MSGSKDNIGFEDTLVGMGAATNDRASVALGVDAWATTLVDTSIMSRHGDAEAADPIELQRARYVAESMLGEGGMGEVLLVRDQNIDRQVAMKRLKPLVDDTTTRQRFLDEVRTIGKLEHPSIVPIHDVGVDTDGSQFFIMKKVEGETLSTIISRLRDGDERYHARYTFEVRIQIFLGILNALDFAHARGFIHRDIKPENVMVGPFGEVVVMDWGLAKQVDAGTHAEAAAASEDLSARLEKRAASIDQTEDAGALSFDARARLTRHGDLLGTPAYMAPEQARGDNHLVDRQTDIYALGVLFQELLTLEHYLSGKDSMLALLYGVCHDVFSPAAVKGHPSQGIPPAEYLHICKHAMSKDKANRYASVSELITAVHVAQSGHFPCECPVTLTRRANNELIDLLSNHPLILIAGLVTIPLLSIAGLVAGVASML